MNATEYVLHGWALCAVEPHGKSPQGHDWNRKENALTIEQAAAAQSVGLLHAYSGTAALDIDNMTMTMHEFTRLGIDLAAILEHPSTVKIHRGDPQRTKVIFSMPIPLTSKKVIIDNKTAYELRCATSNGLSVQDVLPPSIHPSGVPYEWAGDWKNPTPMPTELLQHWMDLIESASQQQSHSAITPASWEEVVDALGFISPDCERDVWIKVGMALHSVGSMNNDPNAAFNLWNKWSSQSKSKYHPEEMSRQWASIKDRPDGIGPGTLFHYASENGWKRKPEDVAHLFREIRAEDSESFTPHPPRIDMAMWPSVLARCADEVSREVGCDPAVPLLAGLCAVSAAADKRARLRISKTWTVPPVIWAMTVGDPSDKKSPGSKPMFSILRTLEQEDASRFATEHMIWQGKEARHAAQMKEYREFFMQPENPMENEAIPAVEPLPPEPQQLRLLIGDATSQKVVHMAQGRPRGFLLYLDEMNNWLRKLNDPRSTEDRGCWINGFESSAYTMDRVTAGSIKVENLAISIYGNVQPDVLRSTLSRSTEDGLLQRFIPVILDGSRSRQGDEDTPSFMSAFPEYEQLVRRVYALADQEYRLTDEAARLFRDFGHWHHDGLKIDKTIRTPSIITTAKGKLTGVCSRLALLFHMIENPYAEAVTAETMQKAISITKRYITPAISFTYREIANIRSEATKKVVEYIIYSADFRKEITATEVRKIIREAHPGDRPTWHVEAEVEDVMVTLTDASYVIPLSAGRNAVWAINPNLASKTEKQRGAYQAAVREMARRESGM